MNDRLADALDEITNRFIMRMVEKDARIAELEAEIAAMRLVVNVAVDWSIWRADETDLLNAIEKYESRRLK